MGIGIVERLRFDATRCEMQFSKGVASNIEEAANEIERLRRGIQDYLAGSYANPRDARKVGPQEKCPHGMFYWDACENCIDEHFKKLLEPVTNGDGI